MYDYLIIGSGLFGATFAYQARLAGKKCLVIDRRPHFGGNVWQDQVDGINIHTYGAHIFHTNNASLWQMVNKLVPFNRYTNSPVANYKGQLYNLPFNMNTFRQMWGVSTPEQARSIIESQRKEALKRMADAGVTTPRNLEEQALSLVGSDIYMKLIKGYTEKQWGRPCNQLPAFIIKRLPVRFVYDNNYFNDQFQGIPIGGYNKLIDRLLEGVETRVNCDFFENRAELEPLARTIVYTGEIDRFFDYSEGHLEYRTVRFETERRPVSNYQGCAVMNFTDASTPFTRCIEHKHFEFFGEDVERIPSTVVSREYSLEWKQGMEPYYPVNDDRNTLLLQRYQQRIQQLTENFKLQTSNFKQYIFGGRLAEYRYYDMAPTMERAISAFAQDASGGIPSHAG